MAPVVFMVNGRCSAYLNTLRLTVHRRDGARTIDQLRGRYSPRVKRD